MHDSVFRRKIDENCALLGCYAASGGNFLWTFRDNHLQGSRIPPENFLAFFYVSLPSSRAWNPKEIFLKTRPIGCPETSAINHRHLLRKAQMNAGFFHQIKLRVETLQF
jgi:hypothetical protein